MQVERIINSKLAKGRNCKEESLDIFPVFFQIVNCRSIVVQPVVFQGCRNCVVQNASCHLHCIVIAVTCKIETKPSYLLLMDHLKIYSDVKVQCLYLKKRSKNDKWLTFFFFSFLQDKNIIGEEQMTSLNVFTLCVSFALFFK